MTLAGPVACPSFPLELAAHAKGRSQPAQADTLSLTQQLTFQSGFENIWLQMWNGRDWCYD